MVAHPTFHLIVQGVKTVCLAHGGGRVVSASGLNTSVSSSTPASAIIYDAYTSIIKNKKK